MKVQTLASHHDALSISQSSDVIDLQADLDRLRQSRDECQKEDEEQGYIVGATWARKNARYRALKRVAALSMESVEEDETAAHMLAVATLDDNNNPDWREVSEEMESLFGHPTPTRHEVAGFVSGATDLHADL